MKWVMATLAVVVVAVALTLLGLGARDGRGLTTAAVEIGRPPAQVFPFLVQPPLRKQWLLAVEEISPSGDPTLRAGARSRVVLDVPERMEVEEEIRVLEAERRLLLQRLCSHPPFSQRLEYVLRDLGAGRTLVTAAIHTAYEGLLFNLGEPLLTRAAQSQLDQEMAQLRAAVESAPAAPTATALPVVSTPAAPEAPPPDAGSPAPPTVPEASPPTPEAPQTPAEASPETAPEPVAPPPEAPPNSDETAP